MRQDTGVGSAYIEVNAIPQTLRCEKEKRKFLRPLYFIFPINRCDRFRQAVNESEMRYCVVFILTVILPPGINLSPVVTDPDNSAELKKTQGSCPCTVTTGIKGKGEREGSDNNGKLF